MCFVQVHLIMQKLTSSRSRHFCVVQDGEGWDAAGQLDYFANDICKELLRRSHRVWFFGLVWHKATVLRMGQAVRKGLLTCPCNFKGLRANRYALLELILPIAWQLVPVASSLCSMVALLDPTQCRELVGVWWRRGWSNDVVTHASTTAGVGAGNMLWSGLLVWLRPQS